MAKENSGSTHAHGMQATSMVTQMNDGESRISIYQHPNPEMKSFLTSVHISNYWLAYFQNPLKENSESALKSLGPIGERVVRDILAIQGVRKVQIKPREVRVRKDPGASWVEIERKVIETLNRAFRRKQFKVV